MGAGQIDVIMEVTSDFPMEEAMRNVLGLGVLVMVLLFAGAALAEKKPVVSTEATYILVVIPSQGEATIVHRVGEQGESTFYTQEVNESVASFFGRVLALDGREGEKKTPPTDGTYLLVAIPSKGLATIIHRVGKGEKTSYSQKEDESVASFFGRVLKKVSNP